MTAPTPHTVKIAPQYGRTLAAWLIGTLTPPIVTLVALAIWVNARCSPESVDCSWGFEFLLAIPVYGLSLITLGPLGVYLALRWARDPLAARTAWWSLALVVPSLPALLVFGLGEGLIPPLAGRYLALRKVRRLARL